MVPRVYLLAYAVLSLVINGLLFAVGKHVPSIKNPDSEFLAPYLRLLAEDEVKKKDG